MTKAQVFSSTSQSAGVAKPAGRVEGTVNKPIGSYSLRCIHPDVKNDGVFVFCDQLLRVATQIGQLDCTFPKGMIGSGKNSGVDVFCEQLLRVAAQLSSTVELNGKLPTTVEITESQNLITSTPQGKNDSVDFFCDQLLPAATQLGSTGEWHGTGATQGGMTETQSLTSTMPYSSTESFALCESILVRMAGVLGGSTARSTLELGSTFSSSHEERVPLESTAGTITNLHTPSTACPVDSLQFSSDFNSRPITASTMCPPDGNQLDTAERLDLTLHPDSLISSARSVPTSVRNNADGNDRVWQFCEVLLSTDASQLQKLDEAIAFCQQGLDSSQDERLSLLDETMTSEGSLLGGLHTVLLNLHEKGPLEDTPTQDFKDTFSLGLEQVATPVAA